MSHLFVPSDLNADDFVDLAPRASSWRRRGRASNSDHLTEAGAVARKQRALRQRIFFVDARATDSHMCFEVLGTTDNSYQVKFAADKGAWSCTCPDYAPRGRMPRHGHRCKHIFFVLARVLHLAIDEHDTTTLHTIDQVEAAMTAQQVARQFVYDPTQPLPPPAPRPERKRSDGSSPTSSDDSEVERDDSPATATAAPAPTARVPQRPFVGDHCCICFDTFAADSPVFFCETTCGKSVHRECFQRLVDFKQEPRCPHCRADMRPDGLVLQKPKSKRRRLS